ncbi:hypothetical protein [Flavobacterium sp.]|uniref:hypothetical protein n=1 Tax=Flavobacterium sp. TaxID=239 RepID=UPI002488BE7A|nr:hypothetical protein [Flavobacterium sp.]MDI1317221.1 hypothetical protein [Flavobacterium sp.]
MSDLQNVLVKILLVAEVAAAVIGVIKFKKFRDTHWKWFIYFLIFIALCELLSFFVLCYFIKFRGYFYDFFVIPVEFLFLFWLYSYKSLGKKKLFWISAIIYTLSLFPYFVFGEYTLVNSFNYIVGTFLLSFMIILEYDKQIKSDAILKFKENMMFYINTAVGLFFVGTLPFFAFHSLIWKDAVIWSNYYLFFMLTNILMYTLFSIALLWGKPNTY